MFGFRTIAFQHDSLRKQFAEHRSQHFVRNFATLLQRMVTIHDDLRFDNRDETCLLAQRRIASQSMGIGFNAAPTRDPIADRNHCAPFGKARAHLKIFLQGDRAIRPGLL